MTLSPPNLLRLLAPVAVFAVVLAVLRAVTVRGQPGRLLHFDPRPPGGLPKLL
jgi:hypothetical protein